MASGDLAAAGHGAAGRLPAPAWLTPPLQHPQRAGLTMLAPHGLELCWGRQDDLKAKLTGCLSIVTPGIQGTGAMSEQQKVLISGWRDCNLARIWLERSRTDKTAPYFSAS